MTIEEKLRKTLQTKTGLKEVINAKGGTITDETPFEEYITQVDNIETGTSGEAIEVSTVEEMEANLTEENKHKFYLYNGEDGQYTNGEYYAVVDDAETVVEESAIKKLIDAKGHCDYLFYAVGATQGFGVTWGETQDISKLISYNDTKNIKYFRNMFSYANITSVPSINMEQAYNISQMFYNAKIENFDITKINLSNVSICDSLFHSIQLLNNKEEILTITIPKNITSWKSLFYNSKIKNLLKIIINTYYLGCISTFQTSGDTTYMKEVEINLYKDKDDTSSSSTSFERTFYNNKSIEKVTLNFENINSTGKYNTYIDANFKYTFQLASALKEVIMKKGSFPIKITSFDTNTLKGCTNITNLKLIGIATNIQLSDNSTYGTLLTTDSLINTCKECINRSSSRTLTIGNTNIEKIANVYVKFVDSTQTTIDVETKGEVEVCESTDTGAMTINEYMALKNWSIA